MKKFFVMLGLLIGCLAAQHSASAEPIIQPQAGKEYYVVHSSGMLLSHDSDKLKVMTAGTSANQAWTFESTGNDSYYIKNVGTSQYVGSDNGWTAKFAATPADMPDGETFAQWELNVSYLADQIVLKNVGRTAYAGTDSNNEASTVYTNKGGNDGKHLWRLVEKVGNVYTVSLDQQIEAAEALLAQVVVGTGHGQYPQAAVDNLNAALAAAKAAKSATEQSVVTEAESNLKAAIQALKDARIMAVDLAKKYAFKQLASGLVIDLSASNLAVLQGLANTNTQIWALEAVEGAENTFCFKNKNGQYLGKKADSNWDVTVYNEPSGDATSWALSLVDIDADGISWYHLRCLGRSYLASDNTGEGSGIYCDKGNGTDRAVWGMIEINEAIVVTEALESAIANAQAALQGITIGDGPNCYAQESVDALTAAIASAQAALAAKASQDAVNAATEALNAATSKFYNSKIIFKADPNKQYYFMQEASSLVVTIAGNVATIDNPAGLDSQKFRLIPAEEGSTSVYNLQLANGTDYLIRKGGWDTSVGTDPSVDVAKWRFSISDLANGWYVLSKYEAPNDHFGTDNTTPGSWVYCNKGINERGRWRIIEVVEGQAITAALEATIAQAQAMLAGAVVGDEPWCYPQAAVDALAAAIAAAQAADVSSQDSVNAATEALQAAVAAFKAAQVQPWFQAEAGVKYRFSVAKYETKYMTNTDGSAKATAAYEAGNVGQQWTLTEVNAATHAFVMYNGEGVLTYDGNVVDPSTLDELPLWRTVYTNHAKNIDYFALVQDADPTKVVTFSSGNTYVVQNLTLTNNAHQGRWMRVDPVNDANLGDLELAIAAAQAALDGVTCGAEIGQYSDAKCDAFQALIDAAKAYYSGKTQAEVDAEVAALNQARTDFINSPNSVIRDELDAALAQIASIADNAVIGIEVGQFYWSQINAMRAKHAEFAAQAKTVTEQDACDALTAQVLAYIESDCKGNAAKQAVAPVLTDAIACAQAVYEAEKDNVGTDKGQRPQAVVDAFAAAIAAAQAVTNPTVADLNALLDAYQTFMAGTINVDLTALNAAIAKAEAAIAGGLDDMNVTLALAFAKAAVAEPNEYTQDEIDQLASDLLTALQLAGIDTASAGQRISVSGGMLTVAGIAGQYAVAVYTADGRLVAADKACGQAMQLPLAPGLYVIAISASEASMTTTVLVK